MPFSPNPRSAFFGAVLASGTYLTPAALHQPAGDFASITYGRADAATCATRIDATGNLVLVAANAGLYDYTWGDKAILSEDARTNRCTNYNAIPLASELTKPSYMSAISIPFGVFYNGSVYTTDLDMSDYVNSVSNTYYIDPVSGNDTTGAGTEISPWKTWDKARAAGETSAAAYEISQKAGTRLTRNQHTHTTAPTQNINYTTYGGSEKAIMSGAWEGPYTFTATGSDTYQLSRSSTSGVVDTSILDANGLYGVLDLAASLAACQATPGTWFTSAGIVYVHTSDGRDLSADGSGILMFIEPVVAFDYGANGSVYCENIIFEGSEGYGARVRATTSGISVNGYFNNCEFNYSPDGNGFVSLGAYTIMNDCSANKNWLDGFNYHLDNTIIPEAYEVDCVGFGNGRSGSTSNNSSTIHDGGSIVRVNCDYDGSYRIIHDIDHGTSSWNIGVNCQNSVGSGTTNSVGFTAGDGTVSEVTNMTLTGCSASGVETPVLAQNDANIFITNDLVSNPNNIESGTGTIEAAFQTSTLTNMSVTGTCLLGLSESGADSAAISAAKIGNVVTGGVYMADGGASGGTVVIAGGVGATGACSVSSYARIVSGTGDVYLGITPLPNSVAITSSGFTRVGAEALVATNVADTLVFTIPAGVVLSFILNQLEVGRDYTSVITTAGATRTRAKTSIQRTITGETFINREAGGMCFSITPTEYKGQSTFRGIAYLHSTGSFPTSGYYLQTNATSSKLQANGKGNNVAYSAGTNVGFSSRRRTSVGMTWENGVEVTSVVGAASAKSVAMSQAATDTLTTLTLGSFANIGQHWNGWIHTITFFNVRPTVPELAQYMLGSNVGYIERGVVLMGQSNAENIGNGVTPNFYNDGERAYVAMQDTILGTSTRNWVINAGRGSTAIIAWQEGASAWESFVEQVTAFCLAGGTVDATHWDQGENDVGVSTASLKTSWKDIADRARTLLTSLQGFAPPFFISPLGKYHYPASYNDTTNNGAIAMRQAQKELADENDYIHLLPEKFHQPLVDAVVHLTDAGYASHAQNCCRKIYKTLGRSVSGGVDGPTFTGSTRSVTTITFPIAHDGGTDLSTTSLTAAGFRFFQNGSSATPIAVNTATYNSATEIEVELNSDPGTGPHTIMYANDLLYNDTQTDLLRDDAEFPLALRSYINTALA